MRYQWSGRRVEGFSVFSLQVLLISFQDSVLSKKNRGRNDSIYLGGYVSVQTTCDILRAGVKACTGLKCDFLIGVCPWLLPGIYVCVCLLLSVRANQTGMWVYTGLGIERVNSRCFNECSKILIKCLDFLQIRKGQGKKKRVTPFSFPLSFYCGKYRLSTTGYM